MQDRILHAHLMIQFGNGLAGFAVLFIPVMLHLNNPANPTMTMWTLAYVILTLAWGGFGLFSRSLGNTLLWKINGETSSQAGGS